MRVRKHQAIQLDQMSSKIGTARVTETQQKEGGSNTYDDLVTHVATNSGCALKKSCSRSQTEFTSLEEVTKLPATMATFRADAEREVGVPSKQMVGRSSG